MEDGDTFRIGLLVPSSNTTMEPDFYRMAPNGVSIHAARMRLVEVTPKGLLDMAEDAEKASDLISMADVDVIVYGCTTGSLVGGVEWEQKLVDMIHKRTGIPTFSTSGAVIEALKLFDGRLGVVTPYSETLNRLEREFLEAHGFNVAAIKGLGLTSNLEIGRTPEEAIIDLVQTISMDSDTIFISCTNLSVINLIETFEKEHNLPVVTSNQASLWAVLQRLGFESVDGYGMLLRNYL